MIPENSWEKECVNIDALDYTNPMTRNKTECFCGDEGKAVLKGYFDCFYTRASNTALIAKGRRAAFRGMAVSPKTLIWDSVKDGLDCLSKKLVGCHSLPDLNISRLLKPSKSI
ncbi:hypothetical protein N0V95_002456 [Ascochyta clinopodiicola]|nr:hypothetical protein N0V95_002456 [Ascochyta clinopodiicola]